MKKNPVVHFEMPAEDKARVKKFYEEVFGWEMRQLGPEMGDYIIAMTTQTDEKGEAVTPVAINGGFYQKGQGGETPRVVVAVEDMQKAIEMVKNAGGQVMGEPMDIPNIGKFVLVTDTEGNTVGMLEPAPMGQMKEGVKNG
jgi:uncharacterized protein